MWLTYLGYKREKYIWICDKRLETILRKTIWREKIWKVNAMTIEEILSKEENQTFDRKSINL